MRKRRRTYEREFKESAVALCRSGERTIKSVAEELGICRTVLGQWVRASELSEIQGLKAFPGRGNSRDEELASLRKENADLRETNEILKKATAYFAAIKTR
jgi:transposase-like protein